MRLLSVFLLVFLFSCSSDERQRAEQQFAARMPDSAVLRKLPLYDSLDALVVSHLPSFFKDTSTARKNGGRNIYEASYFLNQTGALQLSHPGNGVDTVPQKLEAKIVGMFQRIGPEHIYGFRIKSDSTFEVWIRNVYVTEFHLDIRERLIHGTWNRPTPEGSKFLKGVGVTNDWTYLIWYDKRGGW